MGYGDDDLCTIVPHGIIILLLFLPASIYIYIYIYIYIFYSVNYVLFYTV